MQKDNYKKNDYKKDYKKDFSRKPFRKRLSRADFYLEGCPEGVKVPDSSLNSLERALKYLKRQLKDSDKIMKYKAKGEYIKPSTVRRRKKDEAIRMQRYKERQLARIDKGYVWLSIVDGKAQ